MSADLSSFMEVCVQKYVIVYPALVTLPAWCDNFLALNFSEHHHCVLKIQWCPETTHCFLRLHLYTPGRGKKNTQDLCGAQVSRVVLEASRRRQDEIPSTPRFSMRTQEERCLLTVPHVDREDCRGHSPIVDACVLPYALWRPFLSSNCLLLCAHFPLTTLGLPLASLKMTAQFFRASRQCAAALCSMKFAKP